MPPPESSRVTALGRAAPLGRVRLAFRVGLDVHQPALETRAKREGQVLVGHREVTRVRA